MTRNHKKGFTLLELLIVISILAVLTLVVVIFINPVEILKKVRDVQRMSDLGILRTAINLYLQDNPNNTLGGATNCTTATTPTTIVENLGTAAGVKISLGQATQGNLNLSPGAVYAATTTDDLALSTGKGWIPGINFTTVLSGAPISKLPVDPVNTATTGGTVGINSLYYRYGCRTNNTFEIDATLESDAYGVSSTTDNKAKNDGGNTSMRYEVGTDLTILASAAPIL